MVPRPEGLHYGKEESYVVGLLEQLRDGIASLLEVVSKEGRQIDALAEAQELLLTHIDENSGDGTSGALAVTEESASILGADGRPIC